MLRLVNLVWQLFKWTLGLTLVRLLSTALGWEFGVSRQYLRLLEWLLASGRERIAKVESAHRMHLDELDGRLLSRNAAESAPAPRPSSALGPAGGGGGGGGATVAPRPDELDLESGATSEPSRATEIKSNGLNEGPPPPPSRRKVSILRGHFEHTLPMAQASQQNGLVPTGGQNKLVGITSLSPQTAPAARSSIIEEQQRRRRVSTPDGPPIFLLDDDDDDDNDEDEVDHDAAKQAEKYDRRDQGREQAEDEPGRPNETDGRRHKDAPLMARGQQRHEFHLEDAARLASRAVLAICDDEVTKRFTPEELKTWNLLTRTNAKNYQFISGSLGLYWLCGLLIRYAILMPLRIMFTLAGTIWLVCSMTLLGLLVPRAWRNKPFRLLSLMSFRMLSCGITSRLHFHNRQYRACGGDICVANHTSPLDVVLLACDNCYALVGQRHGGLLGLLEVALSRATNHVWFDRAEMRDRQLVTQRLRAHVSLKTNLPVLIFPEGTCINNSAVMMFRKGSFETSARICPAAIKYDSRFGDPFWNSSKQSYLEYLLMMMSSWAIKCDVWYLPPMERLADESSAEFANRVKAAIAKQGGLEDLAWDGQLKRSSVKPTWLYQQQEDYVKRLKLE